MTDATKPAAFERVPNTGAYYPSVHRIPVPGGWIYYIEPPHREPCAVFVPDIKAAVRTHLDAIGITAPATERDNHAVAKAASERAGKNAGVAPELLYAPILWELEGKP